MGKKVEKSLKGEKNQSAVSQDEEDPNKTPGNRGNTQTMEETSNHHSCILMTYEF